MDVHVVSFRTFAGEKFSTIEGEDFREISRIIFDFRSPQCYYG